MKAKLGEVTSGYEEAMQQLRDAVGLTAIAAETDRDFRRQNNKIAEEVARCLRDITPSSGCAQFDVDLQEERAFRVRTAQLPSEERAGILPPVGYGIRLREIDVNGAEIAGEVELSGTYLITHADGDYKMEKLGPLDPTDPVSKWGYSPATNEQSDTVNELIDTAYQRYTIGVVRSAVGLSDQISKMLLEIEADNDKLVSSGVPPLNTGSADPVCIDALLGPVPNRAMLGA